MANETNELKANQVEALVKESQTVLVELSEAQQQVIAKMGKSQSDVEAIAKSVLQSRIKGMYKAYKDGAQKELEKMYDDASRRGFKPPTDKATFIKNEMNEVNNLFNKL